MESILAQIKLVKECKGMPKSYKTDFTTHNSTMKTWLMDSRTILLIFMTNDKLGQKKYSHSIIAMINRSKMKIKCCFVCMREKYSIA